MTNDSTDTIKRLQLEYVLTGMLKLKMNKPLTLAKIDGRLKSISLKHFQDITFRELHFLKRSPLLLLNLIYRLPTQNALLIIYFLNEKDTGFINHALTIKFNGEDWLLCDPTRSKKWVIDQYNKHFIQEELDGVMFARVFIP